MMAILTIQANLPGIFHRAPAPDADAYVRENDGVQVGDTVGLIEVMKNFSEVHSPHTGTVVRFLVENGAMVEVGQDLVELRA